MIRNYCKKSAQEFKKVRVKYFTDEELRWEQSMAVVAASRSNERSP
ncbi:hypothetical protein HQ447_06615 [bacterium]|nr:hypothetical protein [bacterium]